MRTQGLVLLACLAVAGVGTATAIAGAQAAPLGRYVVIAPTRAAFGATLSDARPSAAVALTMAPLNAFVIEASPASAQALHRESGAVVVPDRIVSLVRPGAYPESGWNDPATASPARAAARLAALGRAANPFVRPLATPFGLTAGFMPDPAFGLGPPDPMWNVERIGGPAAWATNGGDDGVTVAVEDTGIDYTHSELSGKVTAVVDLTTTERPQI